MNPRRWLLALCFVLSAAAARTETPSASLETIEKYLNGISTMVADFVQVAPDGGLASGKFYLSRPGRLRWQYDPPTPVLIVASGKMLSYYDIELEQVSHVPLGDSLAGFLARPKIRFAEDTKVVGFTEEAGAIRLTLTQTEKPDEGRLTLVFERSPMQIRKLEVTDAAGKLTHVSLNNLRYGEKLPDSLFVIPSKERFGKPQR